MKKSIIITFWTLVGTFIVILCQFFVPAIRELFKGSKLFLVPFIILFLLGGVLIFFTIKKKVKGRLKKFLLLTGASALGVFVSIFLHNAFYALNTITNRIAILNYLTEGLHVIFFIIAIFICPIAFLIGMVGSIILFLKQKDKP